MLEIPCFIYIYVVVYTCVYFLNFLIPHVLIFGFLFPHALVSDFLVPRLLAKGETL